MAAKARPGPMTAGVDAHARVQRSAPSDGGHETDPWGDGFDQIACGTAAPENSATIRPWRMPRTRSATGRTSSRSEDAIKTALPRAARFRIISWISLLRQRRRPESVRRKETHLASVESHFARTTFC